MKVSNYSVRDICNFLVALKKNNDREWFNANKDQYLYVKDIFSSLAESLIERISKFDPSVSNLSVKDCTYRIYRDIRFSLDKSPYKTHMGVYVCPGGKKSNHSGYYLHIEPGEKSILAVGSYMAPKQLIDSIREDIFSRSQEFLDTIKNRGDFELDTSRALKKLPSGYSSENPMSEYLKQKDYCFISPIPKKYLEGKVEALLDYSVERFESLKNFNDFLNRAIDAEDFSY